MKRIITRRRRLQIHEKSYGFSPNALSVYPYIIYTSKWYQKLMSIQFLFSLTWIKRVFFFTTWIELKSWRERKASREMTWTRSHYGKRSEWNCEAAAAPLHKMPLTNNQRSLSIGIVPTELLANIEGPQLDNDAHEKRSCPADHFWKSLGLDNFRVYLYKCYRERERKVDRSALDSPLFWIYRRLVRQNFPRAFLFTVGPVLTRRASSRVSHPINISHHPKKIEDLCPILQVTSNRNLWNEGRRPISSWWRGRWANNRYHY